MTALELAIRFHNEYERLAPQFGYETRPDTKIFDPQSKNGRLMVAVCGEMLASMRSPTLLAALIALEDASSLACIEHEPDRRVVDAAIALARSAIAEASEPESAERYPWRDKA